MFGHGLVGLACDVFSYGLDGLAWEVVDLLKDGVCSACLGEVWFC